MIWKENVSGWVSLWFFQNSRRQMGRSFLNSSKSQLRSFASFTKVRAIKISRMVVS